MRAISIASQLGPEINAQIAAHWSQPNLQALGPDDLPWQIAEPVDVLLIRPLLPSWRNVPAERPHTWPGAVRVVMSASTGIDAYPPWLLDGPIVTCGRGVNAAPIAEYALAAILAHAKHWDDIRVRTPQDFQQVPLEGLEGKTLGLAGFGSIGQAIATRAQAFGLQVLALRRSHWDATDGVEAVQSIAELAARSDHLVLALPATPQTRHIVNAEVLAQAKPGLHIVNVARGVLIDQQALLDALDTGRVGAATLDVTDPEPQPDGHRFYSHPRVHLTPHVSWSSSANTRRLTEKLLANLDRLARGEALADVVDPARGY